MKSAAELQQETAIHDLGYRRYEGPREGARGAWGAMFSQGLRAMFGLGRSAKAKVVPVFVLVVTLLQALAALLAASVSAGQLPVRYGNVFEMSVFLYVLFIAAQAPEVLSRDQQHRVLPLVLTRSASRQSYATARLAAVVTALFLVVFGCEFVLYAGEIFLTTDPIAKFRAVGDHIFPVLALSTLTALALGGIGAAVAAWTPRRAYATAAIIGLFLVLAAVSTGLSDLAGLSSRWAELLDPIRTLHTLAMVLFGESNRGLELQPPMDVSVYIALTAGLCVAALLLLQLRLRRLET
jgi:ABC-2 type transport system permease protein